MTAFKRDLKFSFPHRKKKSVYHRQKSCAARFKEVNRKCVIDMLGILKLKSANENINWCTNMVWHKYSLFEKMSLINYTYFPSNFPEI